MNFFDSLSALEALDSINQIGQVTRQYTLRHNDHGEQLLDKFMNHYTEYEFKARFRLQKQSFVRICEKVIMLILLK